VTVGLAAVILVLYVQHWDTTRPLWLDEQMIALNVRERSLADLAGPLWLAQSAPYGWLVLQRLAGLAFGESEAALRFVPLAFGAATLVTAVWISSRWLTRAGGPVLVVLVGLGQWITGFVFELKPYSADVFWGLWLPALALWAVETRRAWVWWIAAACGLWIANGALLVTPPLALVVLLLTWRREGTRALMRPLGGALTWGVSMALHYQLVTRHTLDSAFLAKYWAFALPPDGGGTGETLTWLAAQVGPITKIPGGTDLVLLFWLTACVGWVLRYRGLGLVMAVIPVTAAVLAGLGLVPLFERLTLWAVPAVYVGIAIAADRVVQWPVPRSVVAVPLAALGLAVGLLLQDMLPRGYRELGRAPTTNHSLNDRDGVEMLLLDRLPGDVIITTKLALPAIWWYGRALLGDVHQGAQLPDGTPILEARFQDAGAGCGRGRSSFEVLAGRTRAHLYFGFRFDDVPDGFDQLLLDELSRVGSVSSLHDIPDVGRVMTLDLGAPALVVPRLTPLMHPEPVVIDGCISLHPAQRW
jgi:hypothetical protein